MEYQESMINPQTSTYRPTYSRERWTRQRSRVQIVSQVSLEIPCVEDTRNAFGVVQNEVLRWLSNRDGVTLTDEAWKGNSFTLKEVGMQPTEAIKLHDDFWAAQFVDADREVAQRSWTTEFVIKIEPERKDTILFGCRLSCTALGENPTFTPSIPRVVRQVNMQLGGSIDGRPLSQSAWRVEDDKSVNELVDLLLDSNRQRSVIVVSSPPYGEPPLVSATNLAKSLIGVAHVIDLSSEASYILTSRIGREFSVFNGAVRTYRTDFLPEEDQPSEHPRALFERIRYWQDDVQSFEQFLISRTFEEDLSSRHIRRELPSFTTIQAQVAQMERERLREEGATDSDLLELALQQIDELEKKIDVTEQLFDEAMDERDNANQELEKAREQARTDIFGLNSRIDSLLEALSDSGGIEEISYPDGLDSLEDWANKHLSGSVHILNRAYRAAKKSEFEDAAFVYRVLHVLRDHYVPMRKGLKGNEEFNAACTELGIEETPTFSGNRYGEEGDTYIVKFNGRRRLLERHIKNGSNTRDRRRSFRLYFFWDNDEQQVVVGSLPSHLDSRIT